MSRRFQFSMTAILAAITIAALLLWLSKAIGPTAIGVGGGLVFGATMVLRCKKRGLLYGVLTTWASGFIGALIECQLSAGFQEWFANEMTLRIWIAFGWLFAAVCLMAIYLLRLVPGIWQSNVPPTEQRIPDA